MTTNRINRAVKIFLWILVLSIGFMIGLYYNINQDFQKRIESSAVRSLSGEGLGMLGLLLFCYLFYLVIFIGWLIILNVRKDNVSEGSKKNQLGIIFIFSVLPTFLILLFLFLAAPNPFKQYKHVKRTEHEIENGKITRYSADSVKIYEATIVHDKMVGKETTWYSSGVMFSEKNYKENLLDGESIEYDEKGNKRSVTHYVMGAPGRTLTYYANGQLSFLHDPDSLYDKYEWWENGQMKSRERSGRTSDYWEQDGKQTLCDGNGKVTILAKGSGSKKLEQIYKNAEIIKETAWYSNGSVFHQKELIMLNEKEAGDIGCEDGNFRGYKDSYYHENGQLKRISYAGSTGKNKNFYKNIEYDENGKIKD